MICKMVTGGVFACITAVATILASDVLGVVNLTQFSTLLIVVEGFGMGSGVITSQMLGTQGLEAASAAGTSSKQAFAYFFYVCSGRMGIATVCIVVLIERVRRRNVQAEKATCIAKAADGR